MGDNIIFMSNKTNDSCYSSVETLLLEALSDVRSGKAPNDKCVLIILDDRDKKYDSHLRNANMRLSEIVALLDIKKRDVIEVMCRP